MYKKKSNILMENQISSEKLLDKSLEECFNNLSEDIDMTMFLKNLRHLKNNLGNDAELIEAVKSKNLVTQQKYQIDGKNRQFSNKQQNIGSNRITKDNMPNVISKRQIELPVHRIVIKNKSAEKLTEKMSKIEDMLKNKLHEEKARSKTKEKMDEGKFENFYNRLESHKLKTQAKISIAKTKKNMEENDVMTFKPRINPNSANISKGLLDQSNFSVVNKDDRIKMLQQEKEQKEEELIKKECTFKPSINKGHNNGPRSLNDLYKWKEKMEHKMKQTKKEKEKEMKKEYTFVPNINKNGKERRDLEYDHSGARLYAIHMMKMDEKSINNERSQRVIDYSQHKKQKNMAHHSFRQNSRDISRRSSNTSANNTRVGDIGHKKAVSGKKVWPASNRDITPKIQSKFMSNVTKPMNKLFAVEENYSGLDNSGISKEKLKIKKLSLKRSQSKNFVEENVRKLREEEKMRKDMKIAKEKETNKTQKRKYYNSKKDMKIKLNNLENIIKDVSDIESYFDMH